MIGRRVFLTGVAGACTTLMMPSVAVSNTGQNLARSFVDDLIEAGARDDFPATRAAFERHVDLAYIAQISLGEAVDLMTPDQVRRIIPAMTGHLARQAMSIMAYGQRGSVQWGSERARGSGVEVSAQFVSRDRELSLPASGLPLRFYIGPHSRSNGMAVRDMSFGGEWVSEAVGRTLHDIAEITPDPDDWIAALSGESSR